MLTVESLKQQIATHPTLLILDVRSAAEFDGEQGHIATALNVPLEDLPIYLSEFEGDKGSPVFLICRTDRRSAKAAQLLGEAGFTKAHVIQGGMTAWRAKGWPVL